MSDEIPKPAQSRRPPDDSAPLSLEKTPSSFLVTVPYVKAKLAQAELQMKQVAEEAARSAARTENNGRAVISPKFTPYFFAGYTLCGAITAVVVGDPDVPGYVIKAAAIGALFFGGLLGASTGWRK